jgi:Ion channel
MDRTLSDLVFIGTGILVIAWILWDVFEAVVVPRPTPTRVRLARYLTRGMWRVWRWRAGHFSDAGRREQMLGSFAPLLVVLLVSSWVVVLVIGYGLILYGLRGELVPVPDLPSAIYQAGVSLLTIGYGDIIATGWLSRLVELAAAATGLAVVALGITYLFSLYGSFQRREELVTTLDARAGAPPSGLRLLETHARYDVWDDLRRCFAEWELWCARVLDSHVAYPILAFFRSSHDGESWVSALGAVLDAATLVATAVDGGPNGQPLPTGQAILTVKGGAHLVEDVGQMLRIKGTGEVMVEQSEFDQARERLKAAGLSLNPDRDAAWKKFCEVRSGYASTLNGLAAFLMSPPTQWIGDRSTLPHGRRIPQITVAASQVIPIDYGPVPASDPVEAGRG